MRAAVWRGGDRGLVLLLSGRTEFLEKMALPAADLVARGFSVASIDWRGQGLSDRVAAPPVMGHVGRFTDYHLDLAALMAAPQVADLGPVRLMLPHSMGGAIGLGAIYRNVLSVDSIVFSAPMFGIKMSPAVKFIGSVTTAIAGALGKLDKRPPFGDVDTPYVFTGYDGNVLTSDRAVFDWMVEALRAEPGLQIAMPSLRWFDESQKELAWLARQGGIGVPVMMLRGGEEDVVDRAAIEDATRRLDAQSVEIPGARHELLIERAELRAQAWAAIDAFLDANGI